MRIAGYSAATALKVRCQRSCPCRMALDLSLISTSRRPWVAANSKAARMMRSTPLRVFISASIATSSGVSRLNCPPMPV